MSDLLEYETGSARGGGSGGGSPPAILTEGLERHYQGTRALDGVDLSVGRGEVFGLLGPNGAGKSTLVRVLCTLLRPSGGRARVAGHDVASAPRAVRPCIGVALQEAALDPVQTGRELLSLQGRLFGMSARGIRRRLDEVLSLVDIGEAIDHRIATYSGGMKRRLDLAAALVHHPTILFLDEPTTGLDPASRDRVWMEIRRLNAELGMTILLTTQYLEEADALAGRVAIIDRGRLIAEGSPEVLKRSIGDDLIVAEIEHGDPAVLADLRRLDAVRSATAEGRRIVIASADGPRVMASVAVQLHQSRVTVRSLELRSPTLDDVFRSVTGTPMEGSGGR
jgi:ABC-2 type transport system ATP-binding protein